MTFLNHNGRVAHLRSAAPEAREALVPRFRASDEKKRLPNPGAEVREPLEGKNRVTTRGYLVTRYNGNSTFGGDCAKRTTPGP